MKRMLITLLATSLLTGCQNQKREPDRRVSDDGDLPNVVLIFADDLGYGDLGCFGATDIKTPNIDAIASQGIKFTDFYSASSVCSPSRAGLLTGRFPQRMGINSVYFPESFTGLPHSERTIPELLKEKNYTSGIIGKWHLGHREEFLPLQHGFDSYFGTPYSNDMSGFVYMRGNKVESYDMDQSLLTRRLTEEAVDFIDRNAEKPFFLYVAHNMPHVPIYASEEFLGTSERGLYGDVIQELDWSVGQILSKLEDEGLIENTLVIFTSDNGPWLVMRELGGSAGILREGKQFTFDGGMRVPTVAMWKGKIPANRVYEDLATQMDWFPTLAHLTGIGLAENTVLDGRDLSGVLMGTGEREDHPFLYFDGAELQCYRNARYKVKLPFEGREQQPWVQGVAAHDTLLIDLKNDPGEKVNLYPENKDLAKELIREMHATHVDMGDLPPSQITRMEADESFFDLLNSNKEADK